MAYKLKTNVPIKVSVDGFSSYAVITWLAEDTSSNECEGRVKNPIPFSQKVFIDPLPCGHAQKVLSQGTIGKDEWGGDKDVTYKITQLATPTCECDPYKEKDSSKPHEIGIVSSVTMPYFLEAESTATTLHITYYDSFINECGYERIVTSTTSVELSDASPDCSNYGFRNGSVSVSIGSSAFTVGYEFYHAMPSSCKCRDDGEYIEYGKAVYDPSIVPYSGGTVKVTVPYVKITVRDCVETRKSGVSAYTIDVDPNSGCSVIDVISGYVGGSATTIPPGLKQTYNYDDPICSGNNCDEKVTYVIELLNIVDEDGNNVECDCDSGQLNEGGHMMPSYGGTAYAHIAYTATTTYKDCTTAETIADDVVVEVDVEPIDASECDPGNFICVSYDISYGVDEEDDESDEGGEEEGGGDDCSCTITPSDSSGNGGVVTFNLHCDGGGGTGSTKPNHVIGCIAQSLDCEPPQGDCTTDDFQLVNSSKTVYCYEKKDETLTTYKSRCVQGITATTDATWLHLKDANSTKPRIKADIDDNTPSTEDGVPKKTDRTATIEISYAINGEVHTTSMSVTQKKCTSNCNCGNMRKDVEVSREAEDYTRNGKVYVSAATEPPIPYSGYADYTGNKYDLWAFHIEGECDPTYCYWENGSLSNAINGETPLDETVNAPVMDSPSDTQTFYQILRAHVDDNEDPDNDRTFTMAVNFDLEHADDCTSACTSGGRMDGIEIVQEAFVCDCEKVYEDSSFSPPTIPSNGGSFDFTFYTYRGRFYPRENEPICDEKITVKFDGGVVSHSKVRGDYDDSTHSIKMKSRISVGSTDNSATTQYDLCVFVGDEECLSYTVEQEAAPIECSCALIELSVDHSVVDVEYGPEAMDDLVVATYVDPPAPSGGEEGEQQDCGEVTVSADADWITVVAENGEIKCSWGASTQPNVANVTVSLGEEGCETFTMKQGHCPDIEITLVGQEGGGGIHTFNIREDD